jgi:hypothetical protein
MTEPIDLVSDHRQAVKKSLQDSVESRKKRFEAAVKQPAKATTVSVHFHSETPMLWLKALHLSTVEQCERCKKPAPFLRKKDQ